MRAKELVTKQGKKATANSILYLDMDGVLADFFAVYSKIAGVENYKDIPPAKVDPTLDSLVGTDFFAKLPKFPTTDQVVNLAVKYAGKYSICSSPLRGDYANSEKHKKIWIKQNLNPLPKTIEITPNKAQFATNGQTPNILIDDKRTNIDAWEKAGGIGIKYQADEDPVILIQNELDKAYGRTSLREDNKLELKDKLEKLKTLNQLLVDPNTSKDPELKQAIQKRITQLKEDKFDRCFEYAEQLFNRAKEKGLDAELIQVADYQGDDSKADERWKEIPKEYWKHYVVKMGTTVLDPSASQFDPNAETKYPERLLNKMWKDQYVIKQTLEEGSVTNLAYPHTVGQIYGKKNLKIPKYVAKRTKK